MLDLAIRSKGFGFLVKHDTKRFKFSFGMATDRNSNEIFIKDNGKTLIISKTVVLVFDKSKFGLVFGGMLIFGRRTGKFMRNVLDECLVLDEIIRWPIALIE